MPIINFDREQTQVIKRNWCRLKKVGEGAEATCYLDHDDVYKVYNDQEQDHCINNTICKEDLDLESILFPNEIFMCGGKVFATKTKHIDTNYFDKDHLHYGDTPEISKLKDALPSFIKDIYFLSRNHICAKDLPLNTMFDGEKLYAIDTLSYEITDHNTYEENIEYVKGIIELYVEQYKFFYEELNEPNEEFKKECLDLLPYIDEKAKEIRIEYSDHNVRKIKR